MNTSKNAYVLPSGEVVGLPEHCADGVERFTLANGSLVWAVRIGPLSPIMASRLAEKLPQPPRPRSSAS